jgi:hypothetical protein
LADTPPPHVAAAAKIVDDWLKGQPPVAGNSPPVAKLSDAEKLNRARQYDQTKMPAWKDPRTA